MAHCYLSFNISPWFQTGRNFLNMSMFFFSTFCCCLIHLESSLHSGKPIGFHMVIENHPLALLSFQSPLLVGKALTLTGGRWYSSIPLSEGDRFQDFQGSHETTNNAKLILYVSPICPTWLPQSARVIFHVLGPGASFSLLWFGTIIK